MTQARIWIAALLALWLCVGTATATGGRADVFKGKLFPPNVILENQADLGLTREQFTAIRAAVVAVQGGVAEHEWDMREAYLGIMEELDKTPVDEDAVIELAEKALLAENEVKKKQMRMLMKVRNLLTEEQVDQLEAIVGK